MATKLQSKSYLPGYSLVRELDEDPNNIWSRYYLDKKVDEHLNDNHVQRPLNEYSAYDKEILKRTMLEHEAIFRKQVYELHRLYRVQKDMMDEFQTRGLHKSNLPEETSQSNSFSSPMRTENSRMIWQSPHFGMVMNFHENVPFGGTHDMRTAMSYMKESNIRSSLAVAKNCSSLKENGLDNNKLQSHSRRMLDLHLHADAYLDLEDEHQSERMDVPKSSTLGAEVPPWNSNSDSIAKLTLGNGKSISSRKAECLFGWRSRNNILAENAGALNNHTTSLYAAKPEESTSLAMKSKGNYDDGLINKHTIADFRHLDGDTSGRFPFFTNSESGRSEKCLNLSSQSLYSGRSALQPGSLQLNPNKIHESRSPDCNKRESWLKPANGTETSTRSSNVKISNNSSSIFPFMSASLAGSHNNFRGSSSLVSSGTKPLNGMRYLPNSAKELPCLNVMSNVMTKSVSDRPTHNAVTTPETWQNIGNFISGQGANGDNSHCSIESYHRFHLNETCAYQSFVPDNLTHMNNASSSVNGNASHQSNSANDSKCRRLLALAQINLNQTLPYATDDSLSDHVDLVAHKELRRFPSWLQKAECSKQSVDLNSLASDMELNISDNPCQLSETIFSAAEIETKEKSKTKFMVHDSPALLQLKDQKVRANEASDHANKRPRSFLVPELPEKINLALPSIDQVEHSLNNNLKRKGTSELFLDDLNLDKNISRTKVKVDDGGLNAENCEVKDSTNYRSLINLNVELTCSDEQVLHKCMVANNMSSSSQTSHTKTSYKIDLEMTTCEGEGEGTFLSEHESIKSDELIISEDNGGSFDTLARLAAENIVDISMHQNNHQAEVTCHYVSPHGNSLHWFADIALSNNEGVNIPCKDENVSRPFRDPVLDLFEAMTLELEEVKIHELRYITNKPVNNEDTEEEDIDLASQLFTRRRRGKSRRCRQRKDFQKDILPGLVSLSRHEVTEDLQLIGGLMRASGRSWQSGNGRRNSGRNRTNSRAKGRRRLTNCASTSTEIQVSPLSHAPEPARPGNNEVEVVGSSILGWGRTIRRCRRQKILPGNIVLH